MKRAYTDEHACGGLDAALPEIETWPNQFRDYEIEIILPGHCVETGEVTEVLIGEAALLGDTGGSQQVGITIAGEVLDPDKAFGNKVLQVGVDQADGDAEATGELPLGQRLFTGDFGEKLERTG